MFEFDAPVPLTADSDNSSDVALFHGPSNVAFAAYREEGERAKVGARSLDALVKKAQYYGEVKWLVKKTANGSYLTVCDRNGAESHEEEVIQGDGVATASTSDLLCSFRCSGPRERQSDVVKLCESVLATVK